MLTNEKEYNTLTAKQIASSAFWRNEIFCRHFADECTMDIPSAPVGMPRHYDTWEMERCFEWLNRSVRRFEAEITDFYPTADPNLFWIKGRFDLDAFWGDQDGHMESVYYMMLEFEHLKVKYMSWRFDPFAMLKAAGKDCHHNIVHPQLDENGKIKPEEEGWVLDLYTDEINDYMKRPTFGAIPVGQKAEDFDPSPEEVYKRRQINIYQFACGYYREANRKIETLNEEYKKEAFFVGKPKVDPEKMNKETEERMFAWNKLCSPWMYRNPRNKFYFTDDPHVVFIEMKAHGPGCWRPNTSWPNTGHYHQDYLVILILDDLGRLYRFIEVGNGFHSLESIGADIPNFPYYH